MVYLIMEKEPSTKCENGHDAHKLCIVKSCSHPAPICREIDCKCSTIHSKCTMKLDSDEVIHMLTLKGLDYSSVGEEIIKCYDQILKLVEVEKQEQLKLVREPEVKLKGEEGRLYRLLKEGPIKKVKPEMVKRVMEELAEDGVEKLRNEVVEIGKRVLQAVEKSLQELRKQWESLSEAKEEKEVIDVIQ